MERTDFNFSLPKELIAQYPLDERSQSRLLVYSRDKQSIEHQSFADILSFLNAGDTLVLNNTRVIPARFFALKPTGGRLECLVERVLSDTTMLCQVRPSKRLKEQTKILIGETVALVESRAGRFFKIKLLDETKNILSLLKSEGVIPLPPYMTRESRDEDLERYQTIFSKEEGAVAAPTAGLHFDETLLSQIKNKGINIVEITLHVGSGTFLPVQVDDIKAHQMHSEYMSISQEAVDVINQTKLQGNKVIAVGTTVVRSLESAAHATGILAPMSKETDIFIYPGFKFRVIDGMITNFHLPESTLLMLVSAFIGRDTALSLYEAAIQERYRFYSYGDAMLLL